MTPPSYDDAALRFDGAIPAALLDLIRSVRAVAPAAVTEAMLAESAAAEEADRLAREAVYRAARVRRYQAILLAAAEGRSFAPWRDAAGTLQSALVNPRTISDARARLAEGGTV